MSISKQTFDRILLNMYFCCHFSSSFSRFVVFFKEDQVIPIIRSESHTFTDLLASYGGLVGLFMGASLLSFIELIYYLTIRMIVLAFGSHAAH